MKVLLAVLAALVAFAYTENVQMETWHSAPIGWLATGPVADDELINIQVAIKQTNLDLLEQTLMRVSDPASPEYGQHLSVEEVHELVAPKYTSVLAVENWLQSHGVDLADCERTPNSDIISMKIPASIANELVGTEYTVFKHLETGLTLHRTSGFYSVPAEIAEHIDFVTPTVHFPVLQSPIKSTLKPNAEVTPSFLRNLYGTTGVKPVSNKTQVAVAGLIGQYFEESDLQKFFQMYDSASAGRHPNVVGFDGSNAGIEANLDIEYVMSMGFQVNATFWSINAQSSDPFITLAQQMYAAGNPPTVMSISYGENEVTTGSSYYARVNTELQKVGSIGITMLASSGDGGVAGSQSSFCRNGKFIPTFPGASPYITAVGGTQGSNPETGAALSSGGFSFVFTPPTYQASYIKQYFKVASNLPDSSHYNAKGNGFPDVAAQAEDFIIVSGGRSEGVAGTSCSSPTFAGVLSLVNDLRFSKGKSSLGFLNPFIYANPSAFNDITSGNNPGCNTQGFYAAAGWDPVTGLGSPDYSKLVSAALALP